MRHLHLAAILLSSALLLGSIFFGALYLYASRDTVPPNVTISGLDISNMEWSEAIVLIEEQILALEQEKVVVMVQHSKVDSTWGQLGVQYDAADFHAALVQLFKGNLWERARARWNFPSTWEFNITFDEKILRKLFPPGWEHSHFGSPMDAVRLISPEDTISYSPGREVLRIDWISFAAIVRQQILEGSQPKPSSLEVPLYTLQQRITTRILMQEGIKRKIAQFTTELYGSGPGRLHNVEAAARTVDGMVIAPGDIFDYEKVIEEAERKYGFREAPVIFGGKLVPGVGGGICQVSSTLYNAVILAGLDIVERRNHTLPVSYVSIGLDATFAKGYINFRFKNTTAHHLLIQSGVKDGQLIVKLFGDAPDNVTFDIESYTTEIIPVPQKYVANPALPKGSQEVILEGKPGYIVESYRIKKIAGKPVGKTRLSRDTYPPQPTVIAVNEGDSAGGHGGRSSDATPPILEDGVKGPSF
ncbi:VanW family protein [Paenibacillus fonticola]|uniref:VanW family protein n=1 Tax=Paenibacillus fonticola TaxID=379896 RepID=UPI000374916A|nr:VanW family protein [Paenibacillus fonticola]